MNGDDYKWLAPTLLVALAAAIICHARLRRYGLACLVASGISAVFLLTFYVFRSRQAVTLNNLGQLVAWSGVLLVPGFLCGLCVSSLTGAVFLLVRKGKRAKAD